MHDESQVDHGKTADWGRTSEDYASYRPGYPSSFFARLTRLGIGVSGQRILDLGCGTGVLARQFAKQGARVTGVDISSGQIAAAKKLSERSGLSIDYVVGPAESTGLPDAEFDVITASQCWVYFDKSRMLPEVRRMLKPGGRLMTSHLCWLPRVDRIAAATEKLVIKHNPNWTSGDWDGKVPVVPKWVDGTFQLSAMFYYDEPLRFTHESWRGRIRACRGVGATLDSEAVAAFDSEHKQLLKATHPPEFEVLHRIGAHILAPRSR